MIELPSATREGSFHAEVLVLTLGDNITVGLENWLKACRAAVDNELVGITYSRVHFQLKGEEKMAVIERVGSGRTNVPSWMVSTIRSIGL